MPAVSKSQQRLMGMVHAYQQGKLNTKSIDAGLLAKVKEIARGMKDKDAKKFATTKHEGLPELAEDFEAGNKKEHPVETQWHYPIMTDAGFEAVTKSGTGFVRSYDYEKSDHKVTVTTGANADHWEDKTTGNRGLWKELEPHLKSLNEGLPKLNKAYIKEILEFEDNRLASLSFKEYIIETRHSQYAQQKRSRASAQTPPNKLLPIVQRVYHSIKQNKGEVDFNEFKEKLSALGPSGLSKEGVEQLLRIPRIAEVIAELPFAGQGHDFRKDAGGRKDPWAHVKVDRESRRNQRAKPQVRDYFA